MPTFLGEDEEERRTIKSLVKKRARNRGGVKTCRGYHRRSLKGHAAHIKKEARKDMGGKEPSNWTTDLKNPLRPKNENKEAAHLRTITESLGKLHKYGRSRIRGGPRGTGLMGTRERVQALTLNLCSLSSIDWGKSPSLRRRKRSKDEALGRGKGK